MISAVVLGIGLAAGQFDLFHQWAYNLLLYH